MTLAHVPVPDAFDAVDQRWLDRIVALLAEKEARPVARQE